MNKTEQRVTINKQNKAEKTNTISFLINTDVELFCSQGDGMWLSCKWKEEYDCPDICRNWYVYNFKVIAYQIVLDHCAQMISLNQMI